MEDKTGKEGVDICEFVRCLVVKFLMAWEEKF